MSEEIEYQIDNEHFAEIVSNTRKSIGIVSESSPEVGSTIKLNETDGNGENETGASVKVVVESAIQVKSKGKSTDKWDVTFTDWR